MIFRCRTVAIFVLFVVFALPAKSDGLDEYLWKNRPIVVFSDTPQDPRFIRQMNLLTADESELTIRDIIVLTDTDPSAQSDLRLKLRPRGFMLVLVGKDGKVKLRKPNPWSIREISRAIDKWPLRRDEIEQSKVKTD
ncbi:MAG: DUF4174 domain-containing protein [Rhodobacteraceae bacterium]|nr:DUF4174 domain-containing protein [Paracoccaceae bacterium]